MQPRLLINCHVGSVRIVTNDNLETFYKNENKSHAAKLLAEWQERHKAHRNVSHLYLKVPFHNKCMKNCEENSQPMFTWKKAIKTDKY